MFLEEKPKKMTVTKTIKKSVDEKKKIGGRLISWLEDVESNTALYMLID